MGLIKSILLQVVYVMQIVGNNCYKSTLDAITLDE